MLVAKLKNPIKYQVEILPNKFEERVGDCIRIILDSYELGLKIFNTRFEIQKEYFEPLNPSSELEENKFFIRKYKIIKIFNITLYEEDLNRWGYDDSELLIVVAEKLNVEIDAIIDVTEENEKVEQAYKDFKKNIEG